MSWHASQHIPAFPAGSSAPSAKSKSKARSQSRVAAPPSKWSAPKLSEQLVRQHALKNTIIVAFSNKNHQDYTFNWINYVRVSNREPHAFECVACLVPALPRAASPALPCPLSHQVHWQGLGFKVVHQ